LGAAFDDVWPEYNLHGDVSGEYLDELVPRYAQYSFWCGIPMPNVSWRAEGRSP
jgi:hypothetical protein